MYFVDNNINTCAQIHTHTRKGCAITVGLSYDKLLYFIDMHKRRRTWKAKVTLRYQGGTSSTPYNMACGVLAGLSCVGDSTSCLSHSRKSMVASPLQVDDTELIRFLLSTLVLLLSSTGKKSKHLKYAAMPDLRKGNPDSCRMVSTG